MTSQRSVVVSGAVRTAIGTFGGNLREMPAPDLGAVAIGSAVERAGLKPDEIATVVMGIVTLCVGGGQGIALALEAIV
jgi:acetyl-CoA C-acetyltransferase